MDCSADVPQLTHPIDAMYLIHKALRAEAGRVEEAVEHLTMGGSFKPLQPVFYGWALALNYHLDVEEAYKASSLPQTLPVPETEAAQQQVRAQLDALHAYLHDDIARTLVIPRTQRQLRGKIIALRIVQDDLLEDEEETLLPLLRQQLSEAQQWALIQALLIDEEASDRHAMVAWVTQALTPPEQQWLATLLERFQAVPA